MELQSLRIYLPISDRFPINNFSYPVARADIAVSLSLSRARFPARHGDRAFRMESMLVHQDSGTAENSADLGR